MLNMVCDGKTIMLTPSSYLAQGGQACLYADQHWVYKIYTDPAHLIPEGKIAELSVLKHKHIVIPQESIYTPDGKRVGFRMRRVDPAWPLPRLFTTAFWRTQGLDTDKMLRLIAQMSQTLRFVHANGCLQVDGNEFNYLVDQRLDAVYFIDVDSFQTPGFGASAIMPSVRDYTRHGFTESSDWFSLAVVAFQLLTGIHPYKGIHPDFKNSDFAARIKAGVCVLNQAVRVPASVRAFNLIPPPMLEWFQSVFEQGVRVAPPLPEKTVRGVCRRVPKKPISGGVAVEISAVQDFPQSIRSYRSHHGRPIIRLQDMLFVGQKAFPLPRLECVDLLLADGTPFFLAAEGGQLLAWHRGDQFSTGVAAERIWTFANTAYVLYKDTLSELRLLEADQPKVGLTVTRAISPVSTQLYDGFLVTRFFGKTHLIVPLGPGSMSILAVPELDTWRVVDAKHRMGVVQLLLSGKDGDHAAMRLRINPNCRTGMFGYFTQWLDSAGDILNFAVLDTGVIIGLPEDGMLRLGVAGVGSPLERTVLDGGLRCSMRVAQDRDRVMLFENRHLYVAKMRAQE